MGATAATMQMLPGVVPVGAVLNVLDQAISAAWENAVRRNTGTATCKQKRPASLRYEGWRLPRS